MFLTQLATKQLFESLSHPTRVSTLLEKNGTHEISVKININVTKHPLHLTARDLNVVGDKKITTRNDNQKRKNAKIC